MYIKCAYCNKIHPRELECQEKKRQKEKNINRAKKKTKANKYRSTNEWTKLAKDIRINRDNNLCQLCIRGIDTEKKINATNIEVHHIIPIEEDYEKRNDRLNLISICSECHKKAEDGKIKRNVLKKIAKEQEEKYINIYN